MGYVKIIVLLVFASFLAKSQELPEWVQQIPVSDSSIYAIGYSKIYSDTSESISIALKKAIELTALQMKTDVITENVFYSLLTNEYGDLYLKRSVSLQSNDNLENYVKSKIKIRDKMIDYSSKCFFILSECELDSSTVEEYSFPNSFIVHEDWYMKNPSYGNFVFSIGMGDYLAEDTRSIETAIKDAYSEESFRKKVKTAAILDRANFSDTGNTSTLTREISREKSNQTIPNSRILSLQKVRGVWYALLVTKKE